MVLQDFCFLKDEKSCDKFDLNDNLHRHTTVGVVWKRIVIIKLCFCCSNFHLMSDLMKIEYKNIDVCHNFCRLNNIRNMAAFHCQMLLPEWIYISYLFFYFDKQKKNFLSMLSTFFIKVLIQENSHQNCSFSSSFPILENYSTSVSLNLNKKIIENQR